MDQTIVCSNCKTINPAKNLYCQSCGKPLLPNPERPASPPPAQGFSAPTQYMTPVPPPTPAPSAPQPMNVQPMTPPSAMPQQQPYPQQPAQSFPQQTPTPGFQPQPPQGYPQQPPQGYPQQAMPGYGMPPAAYAPPAMPRLDGLGKRVDGWSGWVQGAGAKAEKVMKSFEEELKKRELPGMTISETEFGSATGKRRKYKVISGMGATITAFAGATGKDLYVNWNMFLKQLPDWKKLGILAAIAFGVSFIILLPQLFFGMNAGYFILAWIFGTIGALVPVILGAFIWGYIQKGDIWKFIAPDLDPIYKEDLEAVGLAVHDALIAAMEDEEVDVDELSSKE